MQIRSVLASLLLFCLLSAPAFAAHPLITDDTGTQGKGNFQLEFIAEHSNDNGDTETVLGATISAGLLEDLDLVVGVPYLFLSERDESGHREHERGISDISLAAKWRFYEHEGLGLALKPGITLSTGNESRGLGEGKATFSLFLISTKELEPFTLHLNLGYIANREETRDIWHYSLAVEYAAAKNIKIVGNIGGETNPDRSSSVHPLFALGGIIFKAAENLDIDFGLKTGLNRAEADYTLMTGIAFRF